MEKIVPGKMVSLTYDLYTIDDDGTTTLRHQVDPENPEKIIFGVTEGVIAPLEKALNGKATGDEFNVVANSNEAWGEYDPDKVVELEKEIFEVNGKLDDAIVKVGNYVPMLTADGFRINGLVLEIGDKMVKMDFNHPFAGKTLRFKGKVTDVRDATEQELHMASHSCGCGCHDHEGDGCGCHDHEGEGCGCHDHEGDGCCCHESDGCGCEK